MYRGSQGTGGFISGTCLSRQRGTGKPTEAVPNQSATVPEVPVLGSQTPTSSLDRLVHVHSFETCHPWMMDRNFGRFFEVDFALGHRGARHARTCHFARSRTVAKAGAKQGKKKKVTHQLTPPPLPTSNFMFCHHHVVIPGHIPRFQVFYPSRVKTLAAGPSSTY